MNNRLFVAIVTLLPEQGETGVQVHFNLIRELLFQQGMDVSVIHPYQANKWLRRLFSLPGRALRTFSPGTAVSWTRAVQLRLLRGLLRRAIAGSTAESIVMYAQDPLSASACVQIRDGSTQAIRVVSVIHYNDSEARECVLRGLTSENSMLCRTLLQTERKLLPRLDKIVFVSEFMRRTVIARVPEITNIPITVIKNFTDDIDGTAKGHDREGDVIAIGTFEPRKNQQFLLEVIAEARRIGKSYGMTIVGRGVLEAELRRRSEELGIADLITFAGYVPNASRLISMHRCLAHAALIENMPITLIEALACSKPVLAPAVGGIPEIFTDGVEGFFWDITDVRAAAEKLIKLLETPDLYHRMSEAARRRYEQNFSRTVVAPQWLKALIDGEDR